MRPMPPTQKDSKPSASATQPVDFTCPQCGAIVRVAHLGAIEKCPRCGQKLGKIAQLDQLLARWWEPRRWRADLVKPSVPYLIERLWTADGQGVRLYEGVSPKYTNYDVFRHLVTRLIVQGIEEGWADLTFPPDPLAEDPQYELKILDSNRFASGVERLFPEVDWDEPIQVQEVAPATAAKPKAASRKRRK